VFRQIGRIAQQQAGEAITAAALDEHGLALGDQALHVVVVTQVFARLAIKDLEAFALAGAVQNVHEARGLDHIALLIHEDAGVVLLARRLLDAREQLHDVFGLAGRRGASGGCGTVRGKECGEERGGKPAGAMSLPRGSTSQHRPA